jgi:ribosome-binding protein aMBF1 (putative translation factor)
MTAGEESRRCELCGRRAGRIAVIWIGERNYLVCIKCADQHEKGGKK